MREWLGGYAHLADFDVFRESWNGMRRDAYMADGGRYRSRRHAVLSAGPGGARLRLEPPQPHYQSLEYNVLNGGVERWYEPISEGVLGGATMQSLLAFCARLFGGLMPAAAWRVEVHQFRIEASAGSAGQPTPEGVHRDGVDYVLVMMVERNNIASGTTTIHAPDGAPLDAFTLTDPFDSALLDDRRCLHGVTPVTPLDAAKPAYRDVLVVTFRSVPES